MGKWKRKSSAKSIFIAFVVVLFLTLYSGVKAADALPSCTVEPSTVTAGENAVLTIKGDHLVDFTVPPNATPEECCVTLITDIETVAPIKCCFVITSLDDCLCTLMPNSTIRAGLFSPRL